MPLRVCIFARESLLHWAGYYVAAFREHCDTICIGPATGPADHDFPDWRRVERYVVKNDIVSEERDASTLLAQLPAGWSPDLIVAIQSGAPAIAGISQLACPTAYLSVDTWHDPRDFLVAFQYDFVFVAQKGIVKYMRKMGCCRAFWLPLGCDPAAHYATEAPPEFDVAFIGSTHFMVNQQRVARLGVLESHFTLGFAFGLGAAEAAEIYGKARVIFNASIAQDVNMRVFESLATGKPLVTNREAETNGLFDLFEEEKHLITYTDEDLVQQIQRCLDHPGWARAIGAAGCRAVLAEHTYGHRVASILETVGEYIPDLGRRPARPVKAGLRVAEFVPVGTRRLLDVGMGLDTSRIALRRKGVRQVDAIAPGVEALQQRARSYDTVTLCEPGVQPAETRFDAILWNRPGALGWTWDGVFRDSSAWMVEGGRVLLIADDEELRGLAGDLSFPALNRWLAPFQYKLLTWRKGAAESNFHLVVACRLTCTPDELITLLYQEFPVNGVDTNPGIRLFNGEAPDSPDAARPLP